MKCQFDKVNEERQTINWAG